MLQMCFNAFDKAADLDVLDHPVLNFIYYLVSLRCGHKFVACFVYQNIIFLKGCSMTVSPRDS